MELVPSFECCLASKPKYAGSYIFVPLLGFIEFSTIGVLIVALFGILILFGAWYATRRRRSRAVTTSIVILVAILIGVWARYSNSLGVLRHSGRLVTPESVQEKLKFADNLQTGAKQHAQAHMTTVTNLLSLDESRAITSKVVSLRHKWTPRSPVAPFFTLGIASYLDGSRRYRLQRVSEHLAQNNNMLSDNFGDLLTVVVAKLSIILGSAENPAVVTLKEDAAWPGFHVFLPCFAFSLPFGTVHTDMQYEQNNFREEDYAQGSISFTLPVNLPSVSSSGLYEYSSDPSRCVNGFTHDGFCRLFHEYQVGSLIIHTGRLIHQIAPSAYWLSWDARITLQGHAVKLQNGTWVVYW